MGLFDEIKRQLQEAMDEAQGQRQQPAQHRPQPAPRPVEDVAPPPVAPTTEPPAGHRRRPRPASTAVVPVARRRLHEALSDPYSLRQAILLSEVLDRPLALRRRRR